MARAAKDPVATEVEEESLVSTPTDPSFVAAIAREYGQYVATGPVMFGGALAFVKGSAVPAGHPCVPMWLTDGSITKVGG